MRFLESAPERYEAGMRAITFGRVDPLREALVQAVPHGSRVLEIGCGTGAVTRRLVERGAHVTALDQSPDMLEQARERLREVATGVELVERTAAEIDTLPERGFDAVVASLCLSEMSAAERSFVLREAAKRLRPGGVLAVGDEVIPEGRGGRLLYRLLRAPQALLGWLLVGAVSSPLRDLEGEVRAAGFKIQSERRWLLGSLAALVAEKTS
jgi:demethylmenaquinone methyltransferase/2-methoxy-6-polyprenyl-1,4-benzoquinol methylase